MGRRKLRIMCIMLSILMSWTSVAGTWTGSSGNWQYAENGTPVKSAFVTDAGKTYYLDDSGKMASGWKQIEGRWYFFNTQKGDSSKPEGAMLTGWQWIDGRCYYLAVSEDEKHPVGAMFENEKTPDGYSVDGTGAWSENSQAVVMPGKGIITKVTSSVVGTVYGGLGNSSSGGGSTRSSAKNSSLIYSCSKQEKKEAAKEPEKKVKEEKREEVKEKEVEEKENREAEEKVASPSVAEKKTEEEEVKEGEDLTGTESFITLCSMPLLGEGEIPSYEVEWYVIYTDAETRSEELAFTEHGFLTNGDSIDIGFMKTVVDADGNIWQTGQEPMKKNIYGEGVNYTYILYEKTGEVPTPPDPYQEEKDRLSEWVEKAKEAASLITGIEPTVMGDSAVLVTSTGMGSNALISIAGSIRDTEDHEIIIISKNCRTNGITLKEHYGTLVEYGSRVMETLKIDGDIYYVTRYLVTRSYSEDTCEHSWTTEVMREATCLNKGTERYTCELCGKEEIIYDAAPGHIDEDGDSVCDRCGKRSFVQETGDTIVSTLETDGASYDITWTLADTDYQGGCLYISDTEIPVSAFGGYGDKPYDETGVFQYFAYEFANNSSVNGENLLYITIGSTEARAGMLGEADAKAYIDIAGGSYVTSTESGTSLVRVNAGAADDTVSKTDDFSVRPAIVLAKPDPGEARNSRWDIGDAVAREIDGETYIFRCIDTNYSDKLENHQKAALFLCDDIIRSDHGGHTEWYFDTDGKQKARWVPGPIAQYGSSNDYKYSDIRAFLDAETAFNSADIQIGVSESYTGSTTEGKFGQTTGTDLRSYSIGYQSMNARLFILSVDEAVKYSKYLFRFGGSDSDNPETVLSGTSSAYWLRSPNGTNDDYDMTDMTYVVDLAAGNIHPLSIGPDTASTDEYISTTTTVGVRAAFTLPQTE